MKINEFVISGEFKWPVYLIVFAYTRRADNEVIKLYVSQNSNNSTGMLYLE